MDLDEMTPQELREYADRKDRQRRDLMSRYLQVPSGRPKADVGPMPWERAVEYEGHEYVVDMRRFKSREFFKRAARIQDEREAGGLSTADAIDFYEYCFGGGEGSVDDQVVATVTKDLGYEDYEEVMRIESALFELVGAKN